VLCEKCQVREAEIAVKQVMGDEERHLMLCHECARKTAEKLAMSVMEMILDATLVHGGGREVARVGDAICPTCGLTRREFKKSTRLGCARCYEAFARDIEPIIKDSHRGEYHIGKAPASERLTQQLIRLEADLQVAIKEQRFEDAAEIRDRIRGLKDATPVSTAVKGDEEVAP
jgi:protein arginine kinase activator